MHKSTTVLASVFASLLLLALSSCSKTPAPSTSFVKCKYLGIDHLYTSMGLEQDADMYVVNGDESGSTNKLKIRLTEVNKGTYDLGPAAGGELQFVVSGATYSSHPRRATASIGINKIDSTIYNIHGTFAGHLINVSDSTDYLDVSGEVNVKYIY